MHYILYVLFCFYLQLEEKEAHQKQLQEIARRNQLEEAEQRRLEEIRQNQLHYEAEKRHLEREPLQLKQDTEEISQYKEGTSEKNEMHIQEDGTYRKQPLFKASIGGMRSRISQQQPAIAANDNAEDLDGQSTPAGPMPKSKGGPVPLMSLEIRPPSPAAAMPNSEDSSPIDQNKPSPNKDNSSVLPKALEQALAFKCERAHEMGVHPEDIAQVQSDSNDTYTNKENDGNQNILFEEPEIEDNVGNKGKQRQKAKKKKKKKNRPQEWARQAEESERERKEETERQVKKELYGAKPNVEVEYIQDKLDLDMSDPMYRTFSKIFEVFKIAENEEDGKTGDRSTDASKKESEDKSEDMKKVPHMLEEDDMVEEEEPDENKDKLSKRKLKKLNRLSVAELKQLVSRPDVVEMHDVTAKGN